MEITNHTSTKYTILWKCKYRKYCGNTDVHQSNPAYTYHTQHDICPIQLYAIMNKMCKQYSSINKIKHKETERDRERERERGREREKEREREREREGERERDRERERERKREREREKERERESTHN